VVFHKTLKFTRSNPVFVRFESSDLTKEMKMSNLSWKTIGLAAVVAASAQLATMGAASALVLPVPGQATVGETGQLDGQLLQAHYKKKYNKSHGYNKSYNRQRHGRRYTHKRRGYGHHYGGYWYASPWWVVAAPTVVIPLPSIQIQ
jgi:hypothetical protein